MRHSLLLYSGSRLITPDDPARLSIDINSGGIQPEDEGSYECVAENTILGSVSLAVEIIVLGM